MDIGRCNGAGKRETVPIDQNTQLVPSYLFIAIIVGRSPFLARISLVSVEQCERSIFRISYRIGAGRGRSLGTPLSRRVRGDTDVPLI